MPISTSEGDGLRICAVSRAPEISLETFLREAGAALGLDAVAITRPDAITASGERLLEFLADGRHGDMTWMAETAERRADPLKLWPQARSAIMVAMSYAPGRDPLEALADGSRGAISVYAQGKDYHDVLKAKVRQLASAFAVRSGADVKIFVDTAPLLEKPLAAAAGIGWQGKHTNLVSRAHGSWLFLGAILTTAELQADSPEADHCGSCRRCLDICPTRAFPASYQLDARRCLAYLTIEYKGHIPLEFRQPLANRVFGCDDCLAVCPWNRFAERARDVRFAARAETDAPPLAELLDLDDAAFRKRFAGTPVKRTGRDRIVRNAAIAAGNSRQAALAPAVERLLGDPSALVRAMAVWAYAKLVPEEPFKAAAAAKLPFERDGDVLSEWARAGADRA